MQGCVLGRKGPSESGPFTGGAILLLSVQRVQVHIGLWVFLEHWGHTQVCLKKFSEWRTQSLVDWMDPRQSSGTVLWQDWMTWHPWNALKILPWHWEAPYSYSTALWSFTQVLTDSRDISNKTLSTRQLWLQTNSVNMKSASPGHVNLSHRQNDESHLWSVLFVVYCGNAYPLIY